MKKAFGNKTSKSRFLLWAGLTGGISVLFFFQPSGVLGEIKSAVVETQIGVDDIMQQKNGTVEPKKSLGGGTERPFIAPDQMTLINQSLRDALKENKKLLDEKNRLEQQLKELRGQSAIHRNRIKNLTKQRDDLRDEIKSLREELSAYVQEIRQLREDLAKKEEVIQKQESRLQKLEKEKRLIKQMGLFWSPEDVDKAEPALKKAAERIKVLAEENERLRAVAVEKREELQRQADKKISQLNEENKKLREDSLKLLGNLEDEVQSTFSEMAEKVKNAALKIKQLNSENEALRRDSARLHYNLANLFVERGGYQRAVLEYKKVLEIMPNDAAAHYNLAFISGEYLGDAKTALKHYEQYLYLRPNAEDVDQVKEKILEAKLQLRAHINSPVEKELQKELQMQRNDTTPSTYEVEKGKGKEKKVTKQ